MDSEIIKYAKESNLIITEKALRVLNNYNYKEIIDKLKEKNILFVQPEDIEKLNLKKSKNTQNNSSSNNFYILDQYDITNKTLSQGSVEDFHKLFLDKYNFLSGIIKNRMNFDNISIADAKTKIKNTKVDIIGMVYEKRLSKNGNLVLSIDDLTSEVKLVIVNKDEKAFLKAKEILLDNVVGFKCSVLSQNMFVVNEYVFPDIPFVPRNIDLPDDKYLAIIGDSHIGSVFFREKEFSKFIDWLNNESGDTSVSSKVKYLIIAGDLVDGIGVYPAQFDNLAITDIYKQYELFEQYILKIRKDIDIFIISGNHDAVRLSDPQPAIAEEYLPNLYKQKNVHIMGSPSMVVIEGYKTLMYHGASLFGIYAEIRDAIMSKPDLAMKEILLRRDFMAQYGARETFVPIEKDFMLVREVPDIFVTADVHHHAYSKYKNTHMFCASCWQTTTPYQIELGHIPTISKVLLFNLKNEKVTIEDFKEGDSNE